MRVWARWEPGVACSTIWDLEPPKHIIPPISGGAAALLRAAAALLLRLLLWEFLFGPVFEQQSARITTTIAPHPYQTPTRIHTEARAGAAPTRPTTRPPQIDKCATGGGRRADGGAFADLGRPGGGSGGRGSGPGFCMDPGGCLVGVRWDCGDFLCLFWANSNHANPRPKA